MIQAILVGDSIRKGYQPFVTSRLDGRAQIRGPEQNGGDSNNVKEHIDSWILQMQADVLHLNCGLHDLRLREEGYQVPKEDYVRNLHEIIGRLRSKWDGTIIWATTTPVIDERHQKVKGFDRHERDVLRYNESALAVMREHEVPVNDLHEVVERTGAAHVLGQDGVHFTEEGYRLLAKAVASSIVENAPQEGESSD